MALLFYIDESADEIHHFHLGLLADGNQVAKVETALNAIVDDACDQGLTSSTGSELHGFEMFNMTGSWAKGRSDIPALIAIYERALKVLSDLGIEVISRGVNLAAFHSRYGHDQRHYPFIFQHVLERLNERLLALNKFGLIIADENDENAEEIRRDLYLGKKFGTPGYRGQKLKRIVDTVHFVNSSESRMTQLADLAVYIHRRRAHGPEGDTRLESAMNQLDNLVKAAIAPPTGTHDTIWLQQLSGLG